MTETHDVVVVGGGQAGLAMSYQLKQSQVPHVVLEAAQVGESWRARRWDSFCLVTPNWTVTLPGAMTMRPGLYFLGLAFLHRHRSDTLFGVGDDAEFIAGHIAARRTNPPMVAS